MRKNEKKDFSGIIGGILLIIVGIILFLNVIGVITHTFWVNISPYWPLGLVLMGVAIIFRLRWASFAFLILTIFLGVTYGANSLHLGFVQGSGNIITKEYNIQNFSSVELNTPAELHISQGPYAVKITGDDNIINLTEVKNDNGKLSINYNSMIFNFGNQNIKVYVTMPEVNGLKINGAGSIKGDTNITSDNLTLYVAGAGDIDLDVQAAYLESRISGFGNINLKGSADTHNLIISGAGDIKSFDLLTRNAAARISGAGNAEVSVSETLNATISGAGDIKYKGDPKVISVISGAGNVKNAN